MSALEVSARWGEMSDDDDVSKELREWRGLVGNRLPQSLLIQAQRLIRVGHSSARQYIRQKVPRFATLCWLIQRSLKNRIDQTLPNTGVKPRDLIRPIPQRLLQQASAPAGERVDGAERHQRVFTDDETATGRIPSLGYSGEQPQEMGPNQDAPLTTDAYRAAMSVYVRDAQEKLKIVHNLAQRVQLC